MLQPDNDFLIKLANYKMPFGKYKGYFLIDIPEYYYVWYLRKGLPSGTLGLMMHQMYEIKLNGLEEIIYRIRKQFPK